MPPPEVVVGVRESLMLLVNSHSQNDLTMILKPSAEYNRRAAIILCAGRSERKFGSLHTEINRLWRCDKIYDFRTVQRRFQYASEEESLESTHREDPHSHIERVPALFGWPRARSDGCNEAVDGNCDIRKAIYFSVGRCTGSIIWFKIGFQTTSGYVLIQGILPSQQPRFKSLGLLWRSWKGHKQVSTSQCDVTRTAIEAAFVGMDSATLQRANASENRGRYSS